MSKQGDNILKGNAGKAVVGLAAAAAAAYGVYLWGGPGSRRRQPVTELRRALNLRLRYTRWSELYYAYYARRGAGRPVVFLHSINAVASAHEMAPLVSRFKRQGNRPLYAMEWLGFGHSDRPELHYTPDLLEDQLEDWLDRIVRPEGGADVVALSLGATYAAELARRRPDLIHSLVAIEPAGLGEEPSEIGRAWEKLLFTVPGVQQAFYDRLTTPEALHDFARDNLFSPGFAVPKEYIDYAAETARAEGAARPLDDFLSGRLFPEDGADAFLHLRQPLLVLHGTAEGRRMESYSELPELTRNPTASVAALPTGALPHWELPDEVTDRINEFYSEITGDS